MKTIFLAVLRDPYEVVLDVVKRVRTPAIFSHQSVIVAEALKLFA